VLETSEVKSSMSDVSNVLLFSGGIFIVVVGLRFMNDKGGMLGIALILGGLVAILRACGFEWINQ
jgi:hypothetical protein